MKHIGIAGITVPGALLCIDTIVEESYKRFGHDSLKHPRITYTQPPSDEIDKTFDTKDWEQVGHDLLDSIGRLHKAGADFAIIPSNSPHYAIKQVQSASPISVMSLVDITIAECKRREFKKVGILGVGVTMSDGLYANPLQEIGIESIIPSAQKQQEINDLIYREIIKGKPTEETKNKMLVFIQELKDMGADSFIAGCTEIPIVITNESESPLPFIDTTRLIAQKAFEEAVA
jgi:aspartate racemase